MATLYIRYPNPAGSIGTVTSIGTFDGQAPAANGGTISGNSLFFQSATASVPGMVNTGAQTFAGNKSFNGTLGIGGASNTGALLYLTNNSVITGTSQIAVDTDGFTVNSSATVQGFGIRSTVRVANTAFTLPILSHLEVSPILKGAASTVTKAIGIHFTNAMTTVGAAGSALISDNVAFGSADYAINLSSALPSVITGLLNLPGGIVGVADGTSAAAGNVGEYVSSYVDNQSAGSTGVWTNLTSIPVTAGDWDVTGNFGWDGNGGVATAEEFGVSLFSGNTTTDHQLGYNTGAISGSNTAGAFRSGAIPMFRVSVNATTTVYLKTKITYSVGGALLFGSITARRAPTT